jgi:RNA polymerase sigma-70 factor (ECF subfamily)
MIQTDTLSEIDRYAVTSIACRVHRLIGLYGFSPDDREDLEQQLFVEYLERVGRFRAERAGHKTFVSCLVLNRVASLVRSRRRALARGEVPPVPLPEDQAERNRDETNVSCLPLRQVPASSTESLELQIDVERVVRSLPGPLRQLCAHLAEEGPSATARSLGRARSGVYKRINEIRRAFTIAGLSPVARGGA